MDDGVRSGDPLIGVVKKKKSSGCLIIKKKVDRVGGFDGSDSKNVFEVRKEKKRSRLIRSYSGSGEELLEPVVRRKFGDNYGNGSVSYKGYGGGGGSSGFGSERKRSGLDVFEFDEYDDGFDGKKMRRDYADDRLNLVGSSGSRNVVVCRKKDIYYERRSSVSGGKSRVLDHSGKSRHGVDEDESGLPISFLKKHRDAPDEAIRLQGKNGVLKIMVNKKKKPNFPDKNHDYQEAEERMGSRSEIAVKKNEVIRPSFYLDSKRTEKPVTFARKKQKSDIKLQKPLPVVNNKAEDSEADDSGTSLKPESTSVQADRSKKVIKNKSKRTPLPEITTPLGDKDGKVKRGSGTEKQLLREKIRSMLVDCGWTIDYRPRKNRDYLDAVYINPAGTAFWSIIKAYDALQKQLDEDADKIKSSGDSTPFTPLADEILSKLTRQTRKKIEREMKRKRRDGECSKSAKEVAMKETADGTDSEQCDDKLSFYMKQNHKSLRGRLHEVDHAKQDRGENTSATNSHMIQGRKSRKIGRCTLLVRSSDKGQNSENDGFVPYSGKRTILSWLIDSKIVQMSEKVQYMNRRKTKVLLEGWITNEGVHCSCCSKILTISKFEIHAGSKQRQPFPNIFLESGLSLMQCQIDAWNKQDESARQGFQSVDVGGDDPNDDTCGICGDGGDLICCDGCPSTFHQSCLDIQMLPAGDWHCPNCTCKLFGSAGRNNAEANDGANSSLLLCSLCDKKYHQSCSQEMEDLPVDLLGDTTDSFCGKKCQEVFVHLQKLLGVKHELEAGFSWSLIHRMDLASDASHLGFSQRVKCNSKLAVVLSVMDECFLPIVDRRSSVNVIHNVVYNCGSNFSRLNYSGFYTAILERGDEIVSAASIRIHGTQLAEMPFIGTRHMYRRQGMCRRLLCAIESALSSLKVEKLIIPAIAEHMHTWTENFNFSPLEDSHKQEMKSMNMLVFPGTDMLQKLLLKQESKTESITADSDTKSTKVKESHLLFLALDVKSELDLSPECDLHMTDEAGLHSLNLKTNEASATIAAEQALDNPSNDSSAVIPSNDIAVKSELDPSPEPDLHMTNDCELHSLKVIKDEASTQAPNYPLNDNSAVVPSNDIAVISCSLNSSCEPKLETSINDEKIAIDSEAVNKIGESGVDLNSVCPSDASPAIFDTEKSVLGSPVKHQPSMDDVQDDALKENVDSCSGLAHDSLGETSVSKMEEAITVCNSVSASSIHSAYESATDLGNACNIDVNDSLVEPVDSAEQSFAINTANEIAPPVETNGKSSVSTGVADSHEVNKVDEENENVTLRETSIQFDRVIVVEYSHEIDEKVNESAALVGTVILSSGGNLADDCFYEQDEEVTENTVPVESSIQSNGGSVAADSHEVDEKDERVNDNTETVESSIQSNGGNVAGDVLQELDEKVNENTASVKYTIQSNEGTAPGNSNEVNEKDEKVNQNTIPVENFFQSNGGTVAGDSHEVNGKDEKANENTEPVECGIQSNGGTAPGGCKEVNENDEKANENAAPVEAGIQSTGDAVAGDTLEVNENATPVETGIQSNGSNVTGDSHEGKDKNEKVNERAAAVEKAEGGNVARDSHDVCEKEEKVDCVQPLALDSFDETLGNKITDSGITLAESCRGKDWLGEEVNGGTINQGDDMGDTPKVDVEVAFVEPVLDSLSKTLAQNQTQVLGENLTGSSSVLDESTTHESVSGHQSAVDMESKSHG